MACRERPLGELYSGGELVVVGVRKSSGEVVLKKTSLPPNVLSRKAHHYANMSVVLGARDRDPSAIDAWHGMKGQVATIVVVREYLKSMPLEVLCALLPCVSEMKAPLADATLVYKALMLSGLPANQMRDLIGTSLNRECFYDAFHTVLPILSLERVPTFLSGCHDLCVTTLVLHPGTEGSQRVLDYLMSHGIDRSCRMMICYNGVDLVPFSHQAMKDSIWKSCKVPQFDFKPSEKRLDYFGPTAKNKGLKEQKPTAGTVFVAAGVTRTPRKDTMLIIAMEVKPTVALSANGPPKCRVMLMVTVKVPRSHEAFRYFYAAAQNILLTLSVTNMASKGPIQPIITVVGNPEQAVEAALTLYKTHSKGLVLKWGSMHCKPCHFEDEPVTVEKVADILANDVCIPMETVPVAEMVLRVVYGGRQGDLDNDGTKLGIDVLLGRRIFWNLLKNLKNIVEERELEDEETVENCTFKSEFMRSFAKLVARIYNPKLNEGWQMEHALIHCPLVKICDACGIDVDFGTPMNHHNVPIIHTEMVYFPETSPVTHTQKRAKLELQ